MGPVVEAVLEEFDEYLALQRGRSEHTRRAYLGDLRSLIAFVAQRSPDANPMDLTLPLLRSWLAAQATAGAARTTLARRTSAVKTFTAWASRSGLMDGDPATRLQVPKARRTLPAVLRQDQALDAMNAADSGAQQGDPLALRDRLIVEMLYATGIRVSELCGLDLDDVDSSRRLLRVLGKGNKQRTVPFGEPAQRALASWLADGRPTLVTETSGPALLLGARGKRIDPRQARTVVHRPARAAAQCGNPSARGRGRPSGGAGTAGSLDTGDDAALHPRDGRPAARGARPGPSPRLAAGSTTSEAAQ
jgi:integrase/recombinase XerC